MYQPNLKSVALPVPEIIAVGVLGVGCGPQSWEEEAVEGRGDRGPESEATLELL